MNTSTKRYASVFEALSSLRPAKDWYFWGETYDDLKWRDTTCEPPTREEVEAEIARLQALYDATEYQLKRANEYPDFKEYLDGIVKGDQAQIDAYIAACQAVKAKYPKG